VPLNSVKRITLSYDLPVDKFLNDNKYNLYLQKQTGTQWKYNVFFNILDPTKFTEITPGLSSKIDNDKKNISWQGYLETDKNFNLSW
jgi:hypothetical protein